MSVAKAEELSYLMVRRSSGADANEAVAELRLRKIQIDFQTDPERQVSNPSAACRLQIVLRLHWLNGPKQSW